VTELVSFAIASLVLAGVGEYAIQFVLFFGVIGDIVGAISGAVVNAIGSVFAIAMNFLTDTVAAQAAEIIKKLISTTPVPKVSGNPDDGVFNPGNNEAPAIVRAPENHPWDNVYNTYWKRFVPIVGILGVFVYTVVSFVGTIPMISSKVSQKVRGGFPKLVVGLIFAWPIMMFTLHMINGMNSMILPQDSIAMERFAFLISSAITGITAAVGGPQALVGIGLALVDIVFMALFVTALLGRFLAIYAVPFIAPWLILFWSFSIPGLGGFAKMAFTMWIKLAAAPFIALTAFRLAGLTMAECSNNMCKPWKPGNNYGPDAAEFAYGSLAGINFGGLGIIVSFLMGVAIPILGIGCMYFAIQGSAPSSVRQGITGGARAFRRRMYNGRRGGGDEEEGGKYGSGGVGPSLSEAIENSSIPKRQKQLGKIGSAAKSAGSVAKSAPGAIAKGNLNRAGRVLGSSATASSVPGSGGSQAASSVKTMPASEGPQGDGWGDRTADWMSDKKDSIASKANEAKSMSKGAASKVGSGIDTAIADGEISNSASAIGGGSEGDNSSVAAGDDPSKRVKGDSDRGETEYPFEHDDVLLGDDDIPEDMENDSIKGMIFGGDVEGDSTATGETPPRNISRSDGDKTLLEKNAELAREQEDYDNFDPETDTIRGGKRYGFDNKEDLDSIKEAVEESNTARIADDELQRVGKRAMRGESGSVEVLRDNPNEEDEFAQFAKESDEVDAEQFESTARGYALGDPSNPNVDASEPSRDLSPGEVTVSGLRELGEVEEDVAGSGDIKAEDDDLVNAYEKLKQTEEEPSINLVEQERDDREKFDNDDVEWHLDAVDEIRKGESDEYDEDEVQQYFEDQRELGLWDDDTLDQAKDQAQVMDSGSGGDGNDD
jgi:hypothetical protein